MTSLRRKLAQRRWWPGAVALGLAVLLPSSLGVRWLAHGGLAALAVAGAVALSLGVLVARVEGRTAERWADPSQKALAPADRMASALAEVTSLLLIGAIAAPLVASAGWPGQPLSLGGWILIGMMVRRTGPLPAAILGLGAVAVSLISGIAAAIEAPPWTLLEPHWGSWDEWLPAAMMLGLLMVPVGLGQWATGPSLPPQGARAAAATAGLALWVGMGQAVRAGARFEGSLGAPETDPVAQLTLGLAVGAAAVAVVGRGGTPARWTRIGLGALGTLWFTGPAAPALPAFLALVVPGAVGLLLLRLAQVAEGGDRLVAGLAAAVAVGALLSAPPSFPETLGGAAALAFTLVGMFWYVATRTVGER